MNIEFKTRASIDIHKIHLISNVYLKMAEIQFLQADRADVLSLLYPALFVLGGELSLDFCASHRI
jgi:hypothetical protein